MSKTPLLYVRFIVFLLSLITTLTLSCRISSLPPQANVTTFQGKVIGVTDGDTIKVIHGSQTVKIRLSGIDCPEKKQPFGNRAKQFTSHLAFGQMITVKVRTKGKHGRTVADVILPDGRNLNHEIVRAGLAWWYRRYAPDDRTLKALEAEAKSDKRGLWADKNPVPPWKWRRGER